MSLMDSFMRPCFRCKKPIDVLGAGTVSVGILGLACYECGEALQKAQRAQIDRFTEEAEAKGLVVGYEINNIGHGQLVAKTPEKWLEDHDVGDKVPENSEHRHGGSRGHGEALGAGTPRSDHRAPPKPDPSAHTVEEQLASGPGRRTAQRAVKEELRKARRDARSRGSDPGHS